MSFLKKSKYCEHGFAMQQKISAWNVSHWKSKLSWFCWATSDLFIQKKKNISLNQYLTDVTLRNVLLNPSTFENISAESFSQQYELWHLGRRSAYSKRKTDVPSQLNLCVWRERATVGKYANMNPVKNALLGFLVCKVLYPQDCLMFRNSHQYCFRLQNLFLMQHGVLIWQLCGSIS